MISKSATPDAVSFIEKGRARIRDPGRPDTWNRGIASWALGDKDKARRVIEEAARAGLMEATDLSVPSGSRGGRRMVGYLVRRSDQLTRRIVGICLLLTVACAFAAPVFAFVRMISIGKPPSCRHWPDCTAARANDQGTVVVPGGNQDRRRASAFEG